MFSQVGSRLTSEHAQQRAERNDHSNSAHGHHSHFGAADTGDCGGMAPADPISASSEAITG